MNPDESPDLVVIGGTGFYELSSLDKTHEFKLDTPFGETQAPISMGVWNGRRAGFLPRHGPGHHLAPHQVNYRANIWACHHLAPVHVVAINAVGSLSKVMPPQGLVLPDQIIDYTWGREHTFLDDLQFPEMYVDMTQPYSTALRQLIIGRAGQQLSADSATVGVTQGPRLETAAEIRRLGRDGCHLVGMTGMPEAGLAREIGLSYASLCVVANWAAGFESSQPIGMDQVMTNIQAGMSRALLVLESLLDAIEKD